MTKASDNDFPSLLFTEQGSTPTTPAASHQRLFIRTSDHKLCYVNSSGTVTAVDTTGGVSSGTSFPGSPADGDLYYRTDLDLFCRYRSSGTRWVTTTLYREPLAYQTALIPISANANLGYLTAWAATYDLWLESLFTSIYVQTTNDGSHYWTITLNKEDSAGSQTSIVTLNTSAATVNTWTNANTAIGASYVAGSYRTFDVNLSKTSTPGNPYFAAALSYRLIVT
jgi:hypothetical protein